MERSASLRLADLVGGTVREHGAERTAALPAAIFCYFHTWTVAGLLLVLRSPRRFAVLNDPAPRLAPYRLAFRALGHRIVIGSSGHGGRAAALAVAREVRAGASTFVNPDGPAGPLHKIRPGVLLIAAESGAPIVPVTFRVRGGITLEKRWDRLWLPTPKSHLDVTYHSPIIALREDDEDARARLRRALSEIG